MSTPALSGRLLVRRSARRLLTPRYVLLLEPDLALRSALAEGALHADVEVVSCATLVDLWIAARGPMHAVALVDGRTVQGLMAEEHRHHLWRLACLVPLVLVLGTTWATGLVAADLGVTALLVEPLDADDLALALQRAWGGAGASTPSPAPPD